MSDSLLPACRAACPVCHTEYEQQAVDDPVRRETNPNPKWPVPFEVIEWQPSYTQKVTCSEPRCCGHRCPSLHCNKRRCPQAPSQPIHGAGSIPPQHFRASALGCMTYTEATHECLWSHALAGLLCIAVEPWGCPQREANISLRLLTTHVTGRGWCTAEGRLPLIRCSAWASHCSSIKHGMTGAADSRGSSPLVCTSLQGVLPGRDAH